jgi:hypothetical protein
MNKEYDSRYDTVQHIKIVHFFCNIIAKSIERHAYNHDDSKLHNPEKKCFDIYTPKLADCTYGSEEYKRNLVEMQRALKHHYAENSHHPEHYENGIDGMDLVDVVEMLCDWKAATLRHKDGDIYKSLQIQKERFGISDQLLNIMKNTVDRYLQGFDSNFR